MYIDIKTCKVDLMGVIYYYYNNNLTESKEFLPTDVENIIEARDEGGLEEYIVEKYNLQDVERDIWRIYINKEEGLIIDKIQEETVKGYIYQKSLILFIEDCRFKENDYIVIKEGRTKEEAYEVKEVERRKIKYIDLTKKEERIEDSLPFRNFRCAIYLENYFDTSKATNTFVVY